MRNQLDAAFLPGCSHGAFGATGPAVDGAMLASIFSVRWSGHLLAFLRWTCSSEQRRHCSSQQPFIVRVDRWSEAWFNGSVTAANHSREHPNPELCSVSADPSVGRCQVPVVP